MENNQQENKEQELSFPPKKTREPFIPFSALTKGKKAGFILKVAIGLLISSFLVSFAGFSLIAPNNFAVGGISGIAVILYTACKVPQSITILTLNVPLLIASFFSVRKKFALISFLNVLMQSGWMLLMESTSFPLLVFDEQIFAALASGICMGVAIGLAFNLGGSTGGMDIAAVLVQKKIHASSIAWMIFFLNSIIIAASFFVYKYKLPDATLAVQILPVIKAVCEQYVESRVIDGIENGLNSAIEFRVITDKPEELSRALIVHLRRGVTSIQTTGMYTKDNHAMLVCVIGKRQIMSFKKILQRVDPDSFAVMSNVSQVLGLGFFSTDR